MFKQHKRKDRAFFLVDLFWSGALLQSDLVNADFLKRKPGGFDLHLASISGENLTLILSRPDEPTHHSTRSKRRILAFRPRCLGDNRRARRCHADIWRLRKRVPDLLRPFPEGPRPKLRSVRLRHLPNSETVVHALVFACLNHLLEGGEYELVYDLDKAVNQQIQPDKKFKRKKLSAQWPEYLRKVTAKRIRKGPISWGEARNLVLNYQWSEYLLLLKRRKKLWRLVILTFMFQFAVALAGLFVVWEMKSSHFQSKFFSQWSAQMTFQSEDGPSSSIRFPDEGPFDQRLGYTQLSHYTELLQDRGFVIQRQAVQSEQMIKASDYGFYPPYSEKTQAGLKIDDFRGETIYQHRTPARVFKDFDEVPPLVLQVLLFIENREWMNPPTPYHNPAVEWDRFLRAVLDKGVQVVKKDHPVPGGSTLATQIMKFRHSPDGRTSEDLDKLYQMASASLSAYSEGRDTTVARRRIALEYVNSVPLSAAPGFGEVFSIGDGLFAWYGADFQEVMEQLRIPYEDLPLEDQPAYAENFKRILGLFIAQRRPTYYLADDPLVLDQKCNSYLNLLVDAKIIDPSLRAETLKVTLNLRQKSFQPKQPSFLKMKATQAVRVPLLGLVDVKSQYQLDRLDLSVISTLDSNVQAEVSDLLASLADPTFTSANGLVGNHLLGKGDLAGVIYSFTLYEKTERGNVLRVQTDTVNQPFNYSEGVKLDLGSTAKLRTLLTYLEIIADLYDRLKPLGREDWLAERQLASDVLSQWTLDYLLAHNSVTLDELMDAALVRSYSANPGESFFTGGGIHTFHNFNKADNGRVMPLKEGFKHSVNLVFIRLMRDIVSYHVAQITDRAKSLDRMAPADRQKYLTKFADLEGTSFLNNFYRKYRGLKQEDRVTLLMRGIRPIPMRMSTALLSVNPTMDLASFSSAMKYYLPTVALSANDMASLHDKYGQDKFSLQDRGYLARCHPLELWLVEYMGAHPDCDWKEIHTAGYQVRQEVYKWLFRSSRMTAQNKRIRTMLEMEAFVHIHEQWQKVGYPFSSLTPSYASSIGSSGDRPAALGDLMGIILNDGVRMPPARLEKLHFAEGTPYETALVRLPEVGSRVMHPEVARAARSAMADVVAGGTASRVRTAFTNQAGQPLTVIGKTGTGDHRREVYGSGGRLISSQVLNRTATFAFIIDNRLFGVITAHVPGKEAGNYEFTSSLPLAVLKLLAPKLAPLVDRVPTPDPALELPANVALHTEPTLPNDETVNGELPPEATLPVEVIESDEPQSLGDTTAPLTDAEQEEIKHPDEAPASINDTAPPPRKQQP